VTVDVSVHASARTLSSALRWALPLLVVAATLVAFVPALKGEFVWDDIENFVDNDRFRGLGGAQLGWMWRTTHLGHYIPITWMSLGLSYVLGGMDPWGYHLANLVLHAANAGLFYCVARRLLAAVVRGGARATGPAGAADPGIALSVGAAFAALAFGVHPLRVESVAWVTERRDVLCGFFTLAAVLAYLAAWSRGSRGRLRAGWYGTAVGLFALALLSKSIAVGLPIVLLALDAYPLRRISLGAEGWPLRARGLLVEKLPFLALSVAIGVTMLIGGRAVLTPMTTLGVGQRLAISGYGLMFYLWKIVLPWPLSPMYELHSPVIPWSPKYLLPGAAVVLFTVALILAWRRWPAGAVAWCAYVVFLLPVIGISHNGMQIAADRYTYLSTLGFAVLAGGGLICLLGARIKVSVKAAAVLTLVLVIAGWAAGSWRQTKVWRDGEALWRQAVEADPDCAVCNVNLGAELTLTPTSNTRRAVEAEQLFRQALRISPSRVYAYHGLGVALATQRRFGEAEEAFRQYMRHEPGDATGPADIGLLRLAEGRYAEAIPELRRALAIKPGYAGLGSDLANALRGRGAELRRVGRTLEADVLTAEAEELDRREARSPSRPGQRSGMITAR
jgi:protein O-mannosyl-transferase